MTGVPSRKPGPEKRGRIRSRAKASAFMVASDSNEAAAESAAS